nr:hypothetical protein [Streptomyces sp. WAC 00631]
MSLLLVGEVGGGEAFEGHAELGAFGHAAADALAQRDRYLSHRAVLLRHVPPRAPSPEPPHHGVELPPQVRGIGPRSPTGKNGSTNSHSASERSPRATLDNYQAQPTPTGESQNQ